jgi:hypothetical protein
LWFWLLRVRVPSVTRPRLRRGTFPNAKSQIPKTRLNNHRAADSKLFEIWDLALGISAAGGGMCVA